MSGTPKIQIQVHPASKFICCLCLFLFFYDPNILTKWEIIVWKTYNLGKMVLRVIAFPVSSWDPILLKEINPTIGMRKAGTFIYNILSFLIFVPPHLGDIHYPVL